MKKILYIAGIINIIAFIVGIRAYQTSKTLFIAKNPENHFFIEREKRIERMQKALIISYGLSKYESKYYSYIFDDFSSKYKIPWEAYAALIRIESNYRTDLQSKDGASGIAQI